MRKRWAGAAILGLLMLGMGGLPARAGDSLYGKVIAVKSGDVVTLDYGAGQYDLTLLGIELPTDKAGADRAIGLVKNLVLGKNARMRFEGRDEKGVMYVRLFTDDPVIGIKEVAQELVRAGAARKKEGFDFKYDELAKAEAEAKAARRGIWAANPK